MRAHTMPAPGRERGMNHEPYTDEDLDEDTARIRARAMGFDYVPNVRRPLLTAERLG